MTETGDYVSTRPKRPPLDLKTLYLVYFTSFGAFCLSLISDKQAKDNLYGNVLAKHAISNTIAGNIKLVGSEEEKTRSFCFQRVSSCWFWMENLGINLEKKCILVTKSMEQFILQVENNQKICLPLYKEMSSLEPASVCMHRKTQ